MRYRTTHGPSSVNGGYDRRVEKTQRALHEALIALIREKDYDEIAVREILDRANVGRSTFYTHYRDKDELLVSGIHEMVRAVSAASPRRSSSRRDRFTWFSLPILEHHDRHRRSSGAVGQQARVVLHARLRAVIMNLLREEMRSAPAPRKTAQSIPSDLLVDFVASTFVLVLDWWLASRSALEPSAVNDLFCALVGPVLSRD